MCSASIVPSSLLIQWGLIAIPNRLRQTRVRAPSMWRLDSSPAARQERPSCSGSVPVYQRRNPHQLRSTLKTSMNLQHGTRLRLPSYYDCRRICQDDGQTCDLSNRCIENYGLPFGVSSDKAVATALLSSDQGVGPMCIMKNVVTSRRSRATAAISSETVCG